MKININELAKECIDNLIIFKDEPISIDEIWQEANNAVKFLKIEIRDEIEDILKEKNIKIKY